MSTRANPIEKQNANSLVVLLCCDARSFCSFGMHGGHFHMWFVMKKNYPIFFHLVNNNGPKLQTPMTKTHQETQGNWRQFWCGHLAVTPWCQLTLLMPCIQVWKKKLSCFHSIGAEWWAKTTDSNHQNSSSNKSQLATSFVLLHGCDWFTPFVDLMDHWFVQEKTVPFSLILWGTMGQNHGLQSLKLIKKQKAIGGILCADMLLWLFRCVWKMCSDGCFIFCWCFQSWFGVDVAFQGSLVRELSSWLFRGLCGLTFGWLGKIHVWNEEPSIQHGNVDCFQKRVKSTSVNHAQLGCWSCDAPRHEPCQKSPYFCLQRNRWSKWNTRRWSSLWRKSFRREGEFFIWWWVKRRHVKMFDVKCYKMMLNPGKMLLIDQYQHQSVSNN